MDNASPTSEHPESPTGDAPPTSGPRVSPDQMKDLGRLRRSVTDRRIAGVSGGIARHLDIDPIIVRVALVVAIFFGGAGLLAYIGLWILLPEEGTNDEPLGLDQRSRSLGIAAVGVLALLVAVGDWAGAFWFPWPLAILALIVVWFLRRKDRSSSGRRPDHGYGYGYEQSGSADASAASQVSYATEGGATTDRPASTPYGREPYGPRTPRSPRRRGPILFFFTLALIALGEGVLGVVDLAGASIAGSAYPALALGITATMLLLGSFWGRAGGLIALGVVAALATAAATFGSNLPEERLNYAPTSAAEVRDTYDLRGGKLVLDLSDVVDVDALDGRDIAIDGGAGQVEVIVPDDMDVTVETQLAAGDSRVFDRRQEGIDVNVDHVLDGGDGVPEMAITIDLLVGEIIVREAS